MQVATGLGKSSKIFAYKAWFGQTRLGQAWHGQDLVWRDQASPGMVSLGWPATGQALPGQAWSDPARPGPELAGTGRKSIEKTL